MKYLSAEEIKEILNAIYEKDSQGWPIPNFKKFSKIATIIGIDGGSIISVTDFPSAIHIEIWGVSGDREILIILF